MSASAIYTRPREVTDPGQCVFYHTIDLPGHGCMPGSWDLRRNIRAYLGHVDFAGKRVLDVGAATGFLSFHMESQGAEVVSYDLSPDYRLDLVPAPGVNWTEQLAETADGIRRVNNGYWFCHRTLKSRARVVNGTAYKIREEIGPVDIVTVGSILCHLRDPMLALHNAVRLARDTAIVADTIPRRKGVSWLLAKCLGSGRGRFFRPRLNLVPRFEKRGAWAVWWDVTPEIVRQFLGFLGFGEARINYHWARMDGSPRLLYTVVARRTGDTPPLDMYRHPAESEALAA
jgi:SAM-dependent methyltransferase